MTWADFVDSAWSGRLCLTLLHSVWQVAALAIVVWSADRLWRDLAVERRYAMSVAALLAALTAMPLTYLLIDIAERPIGAAIESSGPPKILQPEPTSIEPSPHEPTTAVAGTQGDAPPLEFSSVSAPNPSPAVTPSVMNPFREWRELAPWLAGFYAAGVSLMLLRLMLALIKANRLAAHANDFSSGPLAEAIRSMADGWGMRVLPTLARSHQITVPTLVGFARPTILLPVAVVNGLSLEQLEMILAHELAHVRRYDMWVNFLQRLTETLLFFNPALWYLSRRINTLREYCCDDMACQVRSASIPETRLHYADALLRVIELTHPHLDSNLNPVALSAGGRSPSEMRRRVARLVGEPLREPLRMSRGGILTLILLFAGLAVGLPVWNTHADPPQNPADRKTVEKANKNDGPFAFHLNVVGPSGAPVPNASVEIRTMPLPTADQFQHGEFVRAGNYGVTAQTDMQGRLMVTLPRKPQRFDVKIQQPGYGPYWAGWSNLARPEEIPQEFTATLDKGWSVGGVVIDGVGQPVVGAEVHPSVYFKKRPGDTEQLGVGTTITTDAEGKWRFTHVPESMADVHVAINHPDYQPLRRSLPRGGFEVPQDEKPSAKIELTPGLVVIGQVVDESGQPIEGALVRTKFLNDIREAKTDPGGFYRLVGCEPRMAQIVVSAKGRARDMREVRIDPEMEPVNFSMEPGGKVRLRVVDEQGKGIPKARIFFQRWRGAHAYFPFSNVNQYADENGVWEWHEAPLDEFQADICRPDGMQLSKQSLIARDEEYLFTPPKALVVSGRVINAETRQPIEKFRVTPGLRNSDPGIRMNWIHSDSYEATDGTYRIRFTHAHLAHLVQIEAEGYQAAVSRDIMTDEGEVEFDFALQPAEDIAATILASTGEPAVGAKIAVGVAGSQITIDKGDIDDGSTYALRVDADAEGRFRIPARTEPFQIVITHPAGFAYLKSSNGPIPERITLTRWARVEGTFRVGSRPAPNIGLTLDAGIHSYGNDVPNIFTHHDVTTGEGGRFVLERVFPGKGRIGRRIIFMVDDGATEVTSSQQVSAVFTSGKVTHLELGGTGHRVVGTLASPADMPEKVLWNFAMVRVQTDLTRPPSPTVPAEIADDPNKRRIWWLTVGQAQQAAVDAYEQRRSQSPYFTATVDRHGKFQIDDVPPGAYVLSVSFSRQAPGVLVNHRFSVPPEKEGQAAEPVELGLLTLEKP